MKNSEETLMLQIQNTLVTLDLAEQFFCCDLEACHGICCVEGDSGAPITPEESERLEKSVEKVARFLPEESLRKINEAGVSYVDCEGDLVTQLVCGENCVFATRCNGTEESKEGNIWLCSLEIAQRKGLCNDCKPASCRLYPLRLTEYPTFTAVNYHKWDVCEPARRLGKKRGIRLYQFLEGPLRTRFGNEWYDELAIACEAYLEEQYGKGV